MAMLTLSPPWAIYYREVDALFKEDRAVTVGFDEKKPELKLFVEGDAKAAALSVLLPSEKEFGNVKMKVTVVPANGTIGTVNDLYLDAFEGNPAVRSVVTKTGVFSNDMTFIIFAKRVVQFFTDNIGDYHGVRSTLYQDVAREVLKDRPGVFYCTDIEDRVLLGAPLGEWP